MERTRRYEAMLRTASAQAKPPADTLRWASALLARRKQHLQDRMRGRPEAEVSFDASEVAALAVALQCMAIVSGDE